MANQNQDVTTTTSGVKAMSIPEAVAFAKSAMSDGKKPTNEEAKKARENEAFRLAVEDVAEKFGKADKDARNRASFSEITDDEWQLLPFAVREWKTGRWPFINGHPTHPMTSVLTREETETYYRTEKENRGKGTAHGPRMLPIADEVANILTRRKDWEIIESIRQAGLAEAANRMAELLPALECPRLDKLFNGHAREVLAGVDRPSLAWLMCRNKEGMTAEEMAVDMATLMAEGFFPTVMKPELDKQVAEFKEAGLDVTAYIDGWL